MSIFLAGLDLGQVSDYSALVIIEASGARRNVTGDQRDRETGLPVTVTRPVEMMPLTQIDVRHVERFPLQTKYTAIAQQTRIRVAAMPAPRYLAVDQTGVGMGVIEHFSELSPIGIVITGGNVVTCRGPQSYTVPKRDLVAGAQLALQNRVLRIAKGLPHGDLLRDELLNFRSKISISGHESFEAWRENIHDDLVLALAIAIWSAQQIVSVNAAKILGGQLRWQDPPMISPY